MIDAAAAIGELSRYLANATRFEHAVPYAAITRRMLSKLAVAEAEQLQVLEQLADHMERFADDVTLYHEATKYSKRSGRTDPRVVATVKEAAAQTRKAQRALATAQQETNQALQVVYPLGND